MSSVQQKTVFTLQIDWDFAVDGGAVGNIPIPNASIPTNTVIFAVYVASTLAIVGAGSTLQLNSPANGISLIDAAHPITYFAVGYARSAGDAGTGAGSITSNGGAVGAFNNIGMVQGIFCPLTDSLEWTVGVANITAGRVKVYIQYAY